MLIVGIEYLKTLQTIFTIILLFKSVLKKALLKKKLRKIIPNESFLPVSLPLYNISCHFSRQTRVWDFSGDPGVNNLPANEGDTGSIPGPGRSHMPQSN